MIYKKKKKYSYVEVLVCIIIEYLMSAVIV